LIVVWLGFAVLPEDLKWKNILGARLPGSIGFTMSIFITLLVFDNPELIYSSKIAILIASCRAAIIGFIILKFTLRSTISENEESE